MIFDNFEIYAFCKCGNTLRTVSNGLLSNVMFCSKCENIYQLQLRKIPKKKISKEFIEQCRKEIENEKST